MRAFRAFNNVDRVDVEWTKLGLRWRMPSFCALLGTLVVGAFLAKMTNFWVGGTVALVLAFAVLTAVRWINGMDPDGVFDEVTQIRMLLRTVRRPRINNAGLKD